MFDFVKRLWEGVRRMLDRMTMKRIIGTPPELTSAMIEKIELWRNMMDGEPPWRTDYVKPLRIEHGICREFADIVLTEMEVSISNEKLQSLFEKNTKDLNENLQDGLGLGSFCIKPLGNGLSEFVTADRFIPISFGNDKKPNDIAFLDVRKVDDNKYYTRVERHSIRRGFLEITNTVYASSGRFGFDQVTSLDVRNEWAKLPESVAYPGMTRMDFGYYRNPLKNSIDDTACGVSIFDSAAELIERADRQGARLDWEFESGERAIHIDAAAIRKIPGSGQEDVSRLNRRLYRKINADEKEKTFFQDFSPAFRDANVINGLERYYRQIEFAVGLSYGDLSDTQVVDKTAEEIKNSKQRKYNRVNAIQSNLKDCLEDFVAGLAFHEGLYTSGYDFICNFRDSIMVDEDKERQRDLAEVSAGIMGLVEYRMKWYGEDEATAKKNLPIQNTVME